MQPSVSGPGHDDQLSDRHSASDSTRVSCTQQTLDHDIYDVSFDGDKDPLSPKSLPLARKWAIVIIVCTGTMCV